uniref:Uncharacterized protein n=1 Tax=Timema monikensis TaxID=170555 RepID=A0A7R9E146_9NEOP|nr:unnamed protein product [Timema monikensis]
MTDYAVNNIDQYGDGYMEPEEEWEREGLLDPAWEKQQKKTCKSGNQSLNTAQLLKERLHPWALLIWIMDRLHCDNLDTGLVTYSIHFDTGNKDSILSDIKILHDVSPQASSTDQEATAVSDDRVNICGVVWSAQLALRPI